MTAQLKCGLLFVAAGGLLAERYITPAGELTTVVRHTKDWPFGDSVPRFSNWLIPRSQKFLIESEQDLPALRFLFTEPTAEDISDFHEQAQELKAFASDRGLLVSGGWTYVDEIEAGNGMGIDAIMWLCGMEEAVLLAIDKPEMMAELVQIVAEWNYRRMEIILDEGVELITKRSWYESTDMWSPTLYRKFILPDLRKEVQLAHQAETKFGYMMTSGVMPIIDDIIQAGVDALIGVDPLQGKGTDLATLKQKARGKLCLWGGVNSYLTIENGSEQDVKEAVEQAITVLGPGGGFVLSPVDSITNITDHTWNNLDTMIATWQAIRAYPG